MTAQIVVVDTTCATSGATQDITSGSFSGTPSGAIVSVIRATAAGTRSDGASHCIGFTDGTNDVSWGVASRHGSANANTYRDISSNDVIRLIDQDGSAIEAEATATLISGGIRLAWNTNPGTAYRIKVTLVGADSLAVGNATTVASSNLDVSLGFNPKVIILTTCRNTATDTGIQTFASRGIGIYVDSSGDQLSWNGFTFHNSASSQCFGNINSSNALAENNGTSFYTVSTPSATGFRVAAADSKVIDFNYIAIDFADESCHVEAITTATSTGTQAITAPGFTPGWLFAIPSYMPLLNTEYTNDNASYLGVISSDGTTTVTHGWTEDDASLSGDTQSLYDTSLFSTDGDGNQDQEADLDSFDASGYTLDWTTADGTGRRWIVLTVEENQAAGGTTGTGSGTAAAGESSGSGTQTFTGSGSPSAASAEATSSGEQTFTGSGSPSAPGAEADGSGSQTLTGSGTGTAANSESSGSGTLEFTATSDVDGPSTSGSGSGTQTFTGSGSPSTPASSVSGSGSEVFTGTSSVSSPSSTASGSGTNAGEGLGSVEAPSSSADSTGLVGAVGLGSVESPSATASGNDALFRIGTGSVEPGSAQASGTGLYIQDITASGQLEAPSPSVQGIGESGDAQIPFPGPIEPDQPPIAEQTTFVDNRTLEVISGDARIRLFPNVRDFLEDTDNVHVWRVTISPNNNQ